MTRFLFLLALSFFFQSTLQANSVLHSTQMPIVITVTALQNPDCTHPLGSITVSATGGTPAYSYLWNTGATTAMISGLVEGDYTVVVTDSQGETEDLKVTLSDDLMPPLADAGAPKMVNCSNTQISLTGIASSGLGIVYQWVASNGGNIVLGAQTLSPVANHSGTYTLTVTNTNNGCTASDVTSVISQYNAPTAQASGGVLNCSAPNLPLSVVFTHQNTQFFWQGPAGFYSVLESPTVSNAGNYVFTVTDTLTGCLQKSTAVVTANFAAPNADANGNGVITCAQPNVTIFGSSTTLGVEYSWTGPNGFGSNQQNPSVSHAGSYTLTVLNPVNGCTATDAVTISSNLVPPTASVSVAGVLTCNTQMVQLTGSSNVPGATYAWTGPNNFSSSIQSPGVSVPGTYILTVKNPANGCTGTASGTVAQNIAPPNATAIGGIKTCAMPNVTLMGGSSTPGVTFSWTGPNNYSSNLQNPSVSVVGSYTLKVTSLANGCTATAITTLSQNTAPPSVWASSALITCTNPLAKITTNSSPQGLSYNWSGPNNFTSTIQSPSVGVAGYYYVTVTNPSNGCTNSTSVYTDENTTVPFAYAGEDKSLNCNFTSILINASFSSSGPNFTYSWITYDGNIVAGATTLFPRVDTAGTYTLKVTNTQNGCVALDSMEVTEATPVVAGISQVTPASCSGGSDGSARANASGGSLIYNYKWSNGTLTAQNNGLSAGTYTVTVTDSDGCSGTATVTVTQLILLAVVNVTHQSIPGVNNGSATVIGSGGTSPYTATWSNGPTTMTINNLAPGTYTVTLTDAKGCSVVKTANINMASCVISGNIAATNATCFGLSNGSATINLTGATNPITYIWSNSNTSKTISGLAAGTYTVTATDGAGCPLIQSIQITSPQALVSSVTAQTNTLCAGSSDGALTAGVLGGVQPYAFLWSNGKNTASIAGLAPNFYSLTVTDANTCTTSLTATISSPPAINISIASKTDVACPSGSNGALSVNVNGGNAPYQYFWSNGTTQSNIAGLSDGTYTLTVTDNNNCSASLVAQIQVQDVTPPQLSLTNATVDLSVNGVTMVSAAIFDNGSSDNCGIATMSVTPNTFNCNNIGDNAVTVSATDLSGNTSMATVVLTIVDNYVPVLVCPANISVGACNTVVNFPLPQVLDNCDINSNALIQVSGLPSGATFPTGISTQSFRYTDSAGNNGQCSFDVQVFGMADLVANTTAATCAANCDGIITLTQISGPLTSAVWSNGQSGFSLFGLCAGSYTATITDVYNCVQTKTVTVNTADTQAPSVGCPDDVTRSFCNSQVFFNTPTVTDNCTVNPANIQQTAGLATGSTFPVGITLQTFAYTDGSGNVGQCSFTVTVVGPPTHQASVQTPSCHNMCNGTATLTLSGGNPPLAVQWSNGQVGLQAFNLCAGNFTYSISDAAGCVQMGSVTLSQPSPVMLVVEEVQNDMGNAGNGFIQVQILGGTAPYSVTWTRNGQFFATSEDLNNLYSGQYIAQITDSKGCTTSSGIITVTNTVGTIQIESAQDWILMPNPASDWAILDFGTEIPETLRIQLTDLNGKVLEMQTITRGSTQSLWDITNRAPGIYFLHIWQNSGRVATKKLLIAR